MSGFEGAESVELRHAIGEEWERCQQKIDKHLTELVNGDPVKEVEAYLEWERCGGKILEPALESGAIALLDAQWLVNFVLLNNKEILPSRKDLPPQAFLSRDQIIQATGPDKIHIICLSYMWLHPKHPDPKRDTLKLVADHCRWKLQFALHQGFPSCPRWGVFWDYASLHQKPRNHQQNQLFQQGIQHLASFFAHQHTEVWKVTEPPMNFPRGYNLPPKANTAPYYNRGWPLFESSLACFAALEEAGKQERRSKYGRQNVLHLKFPDEEGGKLPPLGTFIFGRLRRRRRRKDCDRHHHDVSIPILPDSLRRQLQNASFTNGQEDCEILYRLYKAEFERMLSQMETIKIELEHEETAQKDWQEFAQIIQQKYIPQLRELDLSWNKSFDDESLGLFAPLLVAGQVEKVHLEGTCIGDIGCNELVRAARDCPGPSRLRRISLWSTKITEIGCHSLCELFHYCPLLERVVVEERLANEL